MPILYNNFYIMCDIISTSGKAACTALRAEIRRKANGGYHRKLAACARRKAEAMLPQTKSKILRQIYDIIYYSTILDKRKGEK